MKYGNVHSKTHVLTAHHFSGFLCQQNVLSFEAIRGMWWFKPRARFSVNWSKKIGESTTVYLSKKARGNSRFVSPFFDRAFYYATVFFFSHWVPSACKGATKILSCSVSQLNTRSHKNTLSTERTGDREVTEKKVNISSSSHYKRDACISPKRFRSIPEPTMWSKLKILSIQAFSIGEWTNWAVVLQTCDSMVAHLSFGVNIICELLHTRYKRSENSGSQPLLAARVDDCTRPVGFYIPTRAPHNFWKLNEQEPNQINLYWRFRRKHNRGTPSRSCSVTTLTNDTECRSNTVS